MPPVPMGPLRTITAARDRIRAARRGERPRHVLIRGGRYQISGPITLGPEDSGDPGAPITYSAYPGERPVISGGVALTGWRKAAGDVWTAPVPDPGRPLRQLYVNGLRTTRARSPNRGYFRIDGAKSAARPFQIHYKGDEIRTSWAGLGGVEVVALFSWAEVRRPIRSVDGAAHVATLAGNANTYNPEVNARYWIENAPEALDSPGEWYLDRKNHILSYWPRLREDMGHAVGMIPVCTRLVSLEGDAAGGKPVHDIVLSGLAFQDAGWDLGWDGYADVQAGVEIGAAIKLTGALRCSIDEVPPSDPVCECRKAKALLQSLPDPPVPANGILKLAPGRKQLFLDNGVLARLERIERKLHQPRKYGPVIRPDRPWEGGSIQIRGGPSWNPREKLWMVWYTGGYATSKDGVHWDKPVLNLREYKGSRLNNLMLPRTEYIFKDPITGRELLRQIGDGITVDNPYYDSTDPDAGRRYKAVAYKGPVCCLAGGRGMGFYPAVSPDGRNWRILETAFIPTGDESHFFKDETRNLYVATVKQPGPYGRSVYLSISKDFDHWTDPRDCLIFHADRRDQQLGAERVRMHLERPDLRKPVYNT